VDDLLVSHSSGRRLKKPFAAGATFGEVANNTAVEAEEGDRRGRPLTEPHEDLASQSPAVNGLPLGAGANWQCLAPQDRC